MTGRALVSVPRVFPCRALELRGLLQFHEDCDSCQAVLDGIHGVRSTGIIPRLPRSQFSHVIFPVGTPITAQKLIQPQIWSKQGPITYVTLHSTVSKSTSFQAVSDVLHITQPQTLQIRDF
jgi:hypothetical protein